MFLFALCLITGQLLYAQQPLYTMPAEWTKHEGTWLVWPHDFTYGVGYKEKYEPAWIEMTRQLVKK